MTIELDNISKAIYCRLAKKLLGSMANSHNCRTRKFFNIHWHIPLAGSTELHYV